MSISVRGAIGAVAVLVACAAEVPTPQQRSNNPATSTTTVAEGPLVLFLGNSLTAGFGLAEEQAFPAVMGRRLAAEGRSVRIVNAGVSGDTTAGGLARLDWLLALDPTVVVVGLGANDGLRALDLAATESNLRAIVTRCRETGAGVLLLGMKIPPNYGPEYFEAFEGLYRDIADDLDVPLVPFLLEGVAARPYLNLPDGIHPNADGHEIIADTVLPYLDHLLEE